MSSNTSLLNILIILIDSSKLLLNKVDIVVLSELSLALVYLRKLITYDHFDDNIASLITKIDYELYFSR